MFKFTKHGSKILNNQASEPKWFSSRWV